MLNFSPFPFYTSRIFAAVMLQPLKSRLIIIHTIKRLFYISAQYQRINFKQTIKTAVKIKPKLN